MAVVCAHTRERAHTRTNASARAINIYYND